MIYALMIVIPLVFLVGVTSSPLKQFILEGQEVETVPLRGCTGWEVMDLGVTVQTVFPPRFYKEDDWIPFQIPIYKLTGWRKCASWFVFIL